MYQDGGSFAEGYAIGRDTVNGNYGNGFGFGGDWSWWIIILLIFGWGNGNGFGFGNGGAGMTGYELGKVATTNDVASGFNNSAVLSNLNDLRLGQAGLQQTLCQGFNGINTSILTTGNTIQSQIASCCCDLKSLGLENRYLNEKQTCDLIVNQNQNTQRIIDYLNCEKVSALQAENAALTAQLSQNAQTSAIVNALSPKQPVPAYPVFPATSFAHPTGVTFGFGGYNNDGCGCNNF